MERKLPGTPLILWFFQNYLPEKYESFLPFSRNREFFIGYIDTPFAFMIKIYQSFLHFTQIGSDMSIIENGKAAGKTCGFWREYVGIEPTREVTSPPQRF